MEKIWLANYEEGVPAEVEIPDYPVIQNLINSAEKYPHNTATIFGNVVEPLGNALMDAKMDYRDLLDLTYRFAAGLQKLGVKKGDRVAIHLPNCPQFVIAYYATLMIGGIVVSCNPEYVAREMKHQLNDAGVETIITLSLMYPITKQIRAETSLKHVIVAKFLI
ncbi:MAG: AMP-binding protein [Chloroflexota bacterium]|nr:AMP-binding protein [Chloroflexota bacterium]